MRLYKGLACVILVLSISLVDRGGQAKKQSATPVDRSSLTPEVMKHIFDLMKTYGEAERNKANEGQDKRFNQYLVVIVASRKDVDDAKTWQNGFPSKFTEKKGNEMRRLAFLPNDKTHGLPFYNPDRELHGEVRSLDLGFLENMMTNFNFDYRNDPQYPLVLMYSHYIPCAKVPKLGYSCAEELKNFAQFKQQSYGLLVAYTEFFKNTDISASINFMKEGGVLAFQNMNTYYDQTVKVYPPSSLDGKGTTFQGEFFDCLMSLPVSKCCSGAANNRKTILAFFINDVTYACTSHSLASRYFTERSRNELKVCIENVIKERIGSDCIQCSTKSQKEVEATRNLFKFCLRFSLDVTRTLGKPERNNPFMPSWSPCDCAWKDLYPTPPQKNKQAMRTVMCANRVLSIESMCSAVDKGDNKRAKKLIKALNNRYAEFKKPWFNDW